MKITKWEYLRLYEDWIKEEEEESDDGVLDDGLIKYRLHKLGAEGWELIFIKKNIYKNFEYFFKRPLEEEIDIKE